MPETPTTEPPKLADKTAARQVTVGAAAGAVLQLLTVVGTLTLVKSWADGHAHGQKASWVLFVAVVALLFVAAAVVLWVRQKVKGMGEDKVWRLLAGTLVWAFPFVAAASVALAVFGITQTSPPRGPIASPSGHPATPSISPTSASRSPSASSTPTRSSGGPVTLGGAGGPKILSVTFSPNGRFVAAADADGTVRVWSAISHGFVYHVTDPGSRGVNSVAFSVNSSLMATADGNGHVYLWSGSDLKVPLADPSRTSMTSVAFSSDGTYVAAADTGGNVYVWRLADDSLISTMTDPSSGGYTSVAFNIESSRLVSGDISGSIDFWNHQNDPTKLHDPSSGSIEAIAFNPDSDYLLAGDSRGMVYEWGYTPDGPTVSPFPLIVSLSDQRGKDIDSVAVDPATHVIAAADTSGFISLGIDKFTQVLTDPASRGVSSIAFSPNGTYLAAGDANGYVYLWKLPSL